MAINSTFFLNAANLSLATSVYLDSGLLYVAPDGFYSDGTISRQQSAGVLLAVTTCSTCEPQTTCFEGIWSEETHPEGGSITYINVDGNTVTEGPIFLGGFAVIEYLQIISVVGVSEIDCGTIELTLSYRSDGTSTLTNICDLESPDNTFYIFGNSGYEISTGNTAHNTDYVLDLFDGENKYYVILVGSAPAEYVYIVQINSVGYITVIGTCPVP